MSQFPKLVFRVEGSATGHYTIFGIIGSRTYHNTKQREAVKKYIRECNGERIKPTHTVRKDKRMTNKFMRHAECESISASYWTK